MNNCGKCVGFTNFFHGFGLCFNGEKYAQSIEVKGHAPVVHKLCPGCADFESAAEKKAWHRGYLYGFAECQKKGGRTDVPNS